MTGGGGGMSNELGQTILVRLNVVEQAHTQSQLNNASSSAELRSFVASQFRLLNNNIRGFGGTIQGSLVRQRASNRGVMLSGQAVSSQHQLAPLVEVTPATLSNNPRTLICLWNEYKFGINGRKPAENFTIAERNSNRSLRQKYWRRDLIWKAMARSVRGGRTAQSAAIQIQSAYGYDTSLTKIIEAMIRDKQRYPGGVHPNLI